MSLMAVENYFHGKPLVQSGALNEERVK